MSDGRASEQLAAHLRAGSRQRAGWHYRRGPSYHLQSPDPRETPCSAGGGEETDRCSFDTSLGVREAVRDPSREDSVVAKIVEMAYDGGIATSECSRQFTSDRFGIRLNSTQQFVLIYE